MIMHCMEIRSTRNSLVFKDVVVDLLIELAENLQS